MLPNTIIKSFACAPYIFIEFERSYFFDSHCEINGTPIAPENVPAETWAQLDKSFVYDDNTENTKYNNLIKGFGRKDITVIGKFNSTNEQGDTNTPNLFGHLSCCRFLFLIMRVESVNAV